MRSRDIEVISVNIDQEDYHRAIIEILHQVEDPGSTPEGNTERRAKYNAPDKIREALEDENTSWFLALVDGFPAGIAKAGAYDYPEGRAGGIHLSNLKVLEAFRGKGVANALFEAYQERAYEVSDEIQKRVVLTLGVSPGNSIQAWYERKGFKEYQAATKKHPYNEMIKLLPEKEN